MSKAEKLPRRQSRENAFLAAFSLTFQPEEREQALADLAEGGDVVLDEYAERLLAAMAAHQAELDALIETHLKGWTLGRIPRVSLIAMRIALAEMLYSDEGEDMTAVAINEAVELVKKYGADGDHQFINGLLGTVARERAGGQTPC